MNEIRAFSSRRIMLFHSNAALAIKATGRPDIAIAPLSKDVFVGDWVGIVKFERDLRGTVRFRGQQI
jgi:hypothetical protein